MVSNSGRGLVTRMKGRQCTFNLCWSGHDDYRHRCLSHCSQCLWGRNDISATHTSDRVGTLENELLTVTSSTQFTTVLVVLYSALRTIFRFLSTHWTTLLSQSLSSIPSIGIWPRIGSAAGAAPGINQIGNAAHTVAQSKADSEFRKQKCIPSFCAHAWGNPIALKAAITERKTVRIILELSKNDQKRMQDQEEAKDQERFELHWGVRLMSNVKLCTYNASVTPFPPFVVSNHTDSP